MVSSTRPRGDGRMVPRPLGSRTPMAWHFRERKPSSSFRRMSSASSSEGSSSELDRRPRKMKRGPPSHASFVPYRSGTLRSSRSMPGIALGATWDGRPCPIHGGIPPYAVPLNPRRLPPVRRTGSLYDLRGMSPAPSFYGPAMYATLPPPPVDAPPSRYGSLRSLRSTHSMKSVIIAPPPPPLPMGYPPPMAMAHYPLPPLPPPYLLPPGARPRPYVIPAGAEPLPVRDPAKNHPQALGGSDGEKKSCGCCRGPMPFVWFVVVLVSVGVVLGIILGATLG